MLFITILTLITSLVTSTQADRTVDILAWPLSSSESQSLARISYNAANATVESYTPPKIPVGEDVVRVGFYSSGSWSGVATAASGFDASKQEKRIQLYLNTNGDLFHIGFKTSAYGSSSKTGKSKDGMGVEVMPMHRGPAPLVNKPVVLNADGKLEEKQPEKTFFQKYWWVLAGFFVLQLVMAGSKQ